MSFFNATWHDFIRWFLFMRSCIYDKISWTSPFKCQPLISQEIYKDLFIFYFIYFNFILSFHVQIKLKNNTRWNLISRNFFVSTCNPLHLHLKMLVHVLKNIEIKPTVLYFELFLLQRYCNFIATWIETVAATGRRMQMDSHLLFIPNLILQNHYSRTMAVGADVEDKSAT